MNGDEGDLFFSDRERTSERNRQYPLFVKAIVGFSSYFANVLQTKGFEIRRSIFDDTIQ